MAGINNKRQSVLLFIAISFSISLVLASSIPRQPSSGITIIVSIADKLLSFNNTVFIFQLIVTSLYVSDEPVVLDLNGEDGHWLIETEPGRILFVSLSGDDASDILKHSLKVIDFLYFIFLEPLILLNNAVYTIALR